jgi:hypothetical protein
MLLHVAAGIVAEDVDEESFALQRIARLSCLLAACMGMGFSFLFLFGIAGGLSGIGGGATCVRSHL